LWEGNTWGDRREEVQYEIPYEVDEELKDEVGVPIDEMSNDEE
jgi:hypothetical protein